MDDVSRALWAVAKWIEPIGREAANAIAGEKMYFANDKAKVRDVEGVVSPDETPVAPLFNVVRVLSYFSFFVRSLAFIVINYCVLCFAGPGGRFGLDAELDGTSYR